MEENFLFTDRTWIKETKLRTYFNESCEEKWRADKEQVASYIPVVLNFFTCCTSF